MGAFVLVMVVSVLDGWCCLDGVVVMSMFSRLSAVVAMSRKTVSGLESVCSVL